MKKSRITTLLLGLLLAGFLHAQQAGPALPGEEDIDELEAFEVTGIREGFIQAREEQRASVNFKEVISADTVGKLPDENVAEALTRTPSVYLRTDEGDGRYVSIRGIDSNLNNVTVNGQTIAVSDTNSRDGRAAPLDVMSSASLSQIEVVKVVTPDMDAQSVGGTINLETPSALNRDGWFAFGSFDYGYNDQIGDDANIFSGDINFGTQFGPDKQWGIFVSGEKWVRDYWNPTHEAAGPVLTEDYYSVNGIHNEFGPAVFVEELILSSISGTRRRWGGSGTIDFRSNDGNREFFLHGSFTESIDDSVRPEMVVEIDADDPEDLRFSTPAIGTTTAAEVAPETRWEQQDRPVFQLVTGGEIKFADRWTVDGNFNYTGAKELNPNQIRFETLPQADNSGLPGLDDTGAGSDPRNAVLRWDVSNPGVPILDVISQPNQNGVVPWPNPNADGLEDPAFQTLFRQRRSPGRVEEETWSADLNIRYDFDVGPSEHQAYIKFGAKFLDRDKEVDENSERFRWRGPTTFGNADDGEGNPLVKPVGDFKNAKPFPIAQNITNFQQIFGPQPDPTAFLNHFENFRDDWVLNVSSSRSNSIEDDLNINEKIWAAYFMGEFTVASDVRLLDGLTFLAGARYEDTNSDVGAFAFLEDETADEGVIEEIEPIDVGFDNFLPNFQVHWPITEQILIRASFSRTIGRPDYPDMAPISAAEFTPSAGNPNVFTGGVESGNPGLQPFESDNWEFSVEYFFPNQQGKVSAGVFHKDIENAIFEFEIDDVVQEGLEFTDLPIEELPNGNVSFRGREFSELSVETFNNAEPGFVTGLELNLQYDFLDLPEPLDGLGIAANAAFIDSSVSVFQRPGEVLPFFRQAGEIYNVQVYYQKHGFEGRIAYHWQGDSLLEVGGNGFEDEIDGVQETIDAKISYHFTPNIVGFVSGKNLTDEAKTTFFGNTGIRGEGPGFSTFGRTWRFGVEWNFGATGGLQ